MQENVNILLPVFEDYLTSAPDTASNDAVRQSIVILMGCLAKHLDKDNPRIKPIVAQLIGALSTPSQEVMYTWLITAGLIFFEKTTVSSWTHNMKSFAWGLFLHILVKCKYAKISPCQYFYLYSSLVCMHLIMAWM